MSAGARLLDIHLSLDKNQMAEVRRTFKSLDLSPQKRRSLVMRIGRQVIVTARTNLRAQKTPDGRAWPPRRSRPGVKMLRKIGSALRVGMSPGGDGARVYFSGSINTKKGAVKSRPGMVARWQQDGVSMMFNARQIEKEHTADATERRKKPATTRQKRLLRGLGVKGKKLADLNFGRAGAIIRGIRRQKSKTSWRITIPSRLFLGITDEQAKAIIADQINKIAFGFTADKSQIRSK